MADLERTELDFSSQAELLRLKAFIVSDLRADERLKEDEEECEYESEYGCMHDCATCSFADNEENSSSLNEGNDDDSEEVDEDNCNCNSEKVFDMYVDEEKKELVIKVKTDFMDKLVEELIQEMEELFDSYDEDEEESDECDCNLEECNKNCECEKCNENEEIKNEKKEKIKADLKVEKDKVVESLKPFLNMLSLAGDYSAETFKEVKGKVEKAVEEKKSKIKKENEDKEANVKIKDSKNEEEQDNNYSKEDLIQAAEEFFNKFFK